MLQSLLLKNAALYAPEPRGVKDVLIASGKIVWIADAIPVPPFPVVTLDAGGRPVIPGYVDQHVHIIGGGGESGPYSRTPEVMLGGVVSAGVTTLVGVIGTDATGRHPESLLAKARGLTQEGLSAYILTGSYEFPVRTMTGDVRRDIILIDEVLGVGELAISDHRSSQPTLDELKRVATQARLGGMLSGKAGVLQFHMGSGKCGLRPLFQILEETEIPARHFIPTHVNRDPGLFEEAMEFARKGGYMDITSGVRTLDGFHGGIEPHDAIRRCYEAGVPMERVTMSSDGNGCMSVPLPDGSAKLLVARQNSLHEELCFAVEDGVPLETAIRICGENPARANGLWPRKGALNVGSDGDFLVLDPDLSIACAAARGRLMLREGELLVRGTFE